MTINIYLLTKTYQGYIPSDTLIAQACNDSGVFTIECHQGALKEKLNSIFSTPIYRRVPELTEGKVYSFHHDMLQPTDEGFVEEILTRLRIYGLFGKCI